MSGEVVLVTGGGRGFGAAIARRFASEGAAVAVLSRSRAQLDEVVAAIGAEGGRAFAVTADVTSPADVDRAVGEVEAALGPLTLFVNNAGVPGPFGAAVGRSMSRNGGDRRRCISARRCCSSTASCRGMIARDRGRAIIVSAIASRMVAPYLNAYCTGKIAQNRIVAEAAAELKDKAVKIFAIDPGFVFTALANDTYDLARGAEMAAGHGRAAAGGVGEAG